MMFANTFFALLLILLSAPAACGDQHAQDQPPRLEITLADSIALALQNNRRLMNARLGRTAQKFDPKVAEDEFWPDVTLGSSAQYTIEGSEDNRGYNTRPALSSGVTLRIPTGGEFSVSWDNAFQDKWNQKSYSNASAFRFKQPLLKGGGTAVATANLKNARRREEINILSFKAILIDIVTSVTTAYRSFVQARQQVDINARSLQRARDQLAVNQLLIQTGRMAARDIIQTEANIANRELSLTETRNRLDNARLALINVLDIDSRAQIDPTEVLTIDPIHIHPDLTDSLDDAFRNRPDYLQTVLALENVKTNLLVARNNRLWDLSLTVSANSDGSRKSFGETLDNALGHVDRVNYGVGLGLTIPLYGDLSRQQRYVNAQIALKQAEHSLLELRQAIDIEVRNAVRDIDVRLRQVGLARRARELAEQKLEIEREKLRLGLSTNFQLGFQPRHCFGEDIRRSTNFQLGFQPRHCFGEDIRRGLSGPRRHGGLQSSHSGCHL